MKSSSLTVGIIAPPWLPVPPVAYGGTENVLDVLARGLQGAGHDVVLFTTGDATCPVPRAFCYDSSLGVGNGGAVEEIRHVLAAYDALADVDIVHDHTMTGPLYASGFSDLPVITTNHGPFNAMLSPLYRAVADTVPVIAISRHQAASADGARIAAVIHHGIDVDRIPVGAGEGGYAVFLGRMHPDKGLDIAIAAARVAGMPLRIAAKMTEAMERRYFEARIAPLLGGDVEYVGELQTADKLELLGGAKCLLNPIRWAEPFGMVMIEAFACGTPVVASDRGSVPEIVTDGETGFVCRIDRGDEIVELGEGLEHIDKIDRRGCRAEAETRFSARRMVADHVEAYRATIARKAGRRWVGSADGHTQGVTQGTITPVAARSASAA
ncbi:MAG: glycosyltransferase family 4 protein [Acidimicrobiales bacterium]